jgi:hypothetical protein
VAVTAVALVPLFLVLANFISQVPSTPPTNQPPRPDFLGTLLLTLGVVVIGAILAFIGEIGGVVLGLWRVGTRYGETVIKVGAIFTVIPLLSTVAPILILVGALEVKGRLAHFQSPAVI